MKTFKILTTDGDPILLKGNKIYFINDMANCFAPNVEGVIILNAQQIIYAQEVQDSESSIEA
jgi:hypothetical protein